MKANRIFQALAVVVAITVQFGAVADDNASLPETEYATVQPETIRVAATPAGAAIDCFYAWNTDLAACQAPASGRRIDELALAAP